MNKIINLRIKEKVPSGLKRSLNQKERAVAFLNIEGAFNNSGTELELTNEMLPWMLS